MKTTALSRASTGRKRGGALAVAPDPDATARYNEVVAKARLISVQLEKMTAELHLERMPPDEELHMSLPAPEFFGRFVDGSRTLVCGVRLKVELLPRATDAEPVVEVFAQYALLYELPEGLTCEARIAHTFAGRNAIFNAWPFFRELAHSSVLRMEMPPLVVPLYRMPPHPAAFNK